MLTESLKKVGQQPNLDINARLENGGQRITLAAFFWGQRLNEDDTIQYKFKLTIEGDCLMQRGIGNRFNEDYTRLQADAKKIP